LSRDPSAAVALGSWITVTTTTKVLSVVSLGFGDTIWTFDHPVSWDSSTEDELRVKSIAVSSSSHPNPDEIMQVYSSGVQNGDQWHIDSLPTHVTADPPIKVPQSGLVI
jgi:hypothetical protein